MPSSLQSLRAALPVDTCRVLGGAFVPWDDTAIASGPAGRAPRPPRVGSSFGDNDAKITVCKEGFRCVSKISRFGAGHVENKEVELDKAREAQNANKEAGGQTTAGVNSTESPQKPQEDNGENTEEYEWDCPAAHKWEKDKFESGGDVDQCRDADDCICIARGAENSTVQLVEGSEKRQETVETEKGCGGSQSEQRQTLWIIPHYQFRNLPEKFDPDDVNSAMGSVYEYPKDDWIKEYKSQAPKMQHSLDRLRHYIQHTYNRKVAGRGPGQAVCGEAAPGMQVSMRPDEVHEAVVKLRRFQMLQQDCVQMRDTVPTLISPTSEKVLPAGQQFQPDGLGLDKEPLNCYKGKDSPVCVQLNCYTGHDDTSFRDNMREFEAKMAECEGEPEDMAVKREDETSLATNTPSDNNTVAAANGAGAGAGAAGEGAASETAAKASEGGEEVNSTEGGGKDTEGVNSQGFPAASLPLLVLKPAAAPPGPSSRAGRRDGRTFL